MKKFIIGAVIALATMTASASNGIFRIINNSVETIIRVHVAPPIRSSYGKNDILGSRLINPQESAIVDPGDFSDAENECLLDVMAIGENGSKWEKRFNVCEVTTWTLRGGRGPVL
jgi:hypothetical protein